MTNGERIEGNRLIAEFMGFVNTTPTDPDFNIYMNTDGVMRELFGMQYHNRWDWIMPVVEKIELLNNCRNSILICKDWVSINVPIAGEANKFFESKCCRDKLKNTWNVCVDFIKWHNSQNNG